jgi:hypothetical protein
MRRNAMREKQFIVLFCGDGKRAASARSAVASYKVLRMELTNKWSGDEPKIRR